MNIRDISNLMNTFAPEELALDFDNVGLLIGDYNDEVKGIVICVDVTKDIIDYCIEHECNLIISHHPVLFSPIKKIVSNQYDMVSDLIYAAIQNKINIYAAHTNMDNADKGINQVLGKMFGLKNIHTLLPDGSGIYGDLEKKITAKEFSHVIENNIFDKNLRVYGDNKISRVGIISGAGGRDNIIELCKEKGIDLFISAEFKHNIKLEFIHNGIGVIEFGHYESEVIFINIVYNILKNINKIDVDIYRCMSPLFIKI